VTVDRRSLIGGAGALVAAGLAGSACSRTAAAPVRAIRAEIPAAEIAGGRRVVVTIAENPVEVFRNQGAVVARMLRCTHSGCVVRWDAPTRSYLCPCHDGRFDENGRAVAGPPPSPLRVLPAAIVGDRVRIG
jgi:nitrite reductase/ring-hydroxylating ferredoxin subunit